MTARPQVELPELPIPEDYNGTAYTADQMHAYAWQAIAESEARAEGDARRYRWLRDEHGLSRLPYDDHGLGPDYPTGHDLDAAIDAAIAQEAEREAGSA